MQKKTENYPEFLNRLRERLNYSEKLTDIFPIEVDGSKFSLRDSSTLDEDFFENIKENRDRDSLNCSEELLQDESTIQEGEPGFPDF